MIRYSKRKRLVGKIVSVCLLLYFPSCANNCTSSDWTPGHRYNVYYRDTDGHDVDVLVTADSTGTLTVAGCDHIHSVESWDHFLV
jgi:hypothetical protein